MSFRWFVKQASSNHEYEQKGRQPKLKGKARKQLKATPTLVDYNFIRSVVYD